LFRVAAESLPQQLGEIEALARLWQRETFLLPVSLYIDAEGLEGAGTELHSAFQRFLSRGLGLVFLSVRDAPLRLSVPSFPVEVRKPTAAEQFAAWESVLSAEDPAADASTAAAVLSGQVDL